MKGVLIFKSQYDTMRTLENWSNLAACNATDFIFIPPSYPIDDSVNMTKAIKQFLNARGSKTANIWIGTQGVDSCNVFKDYTAAKLMSNLQAIYDGLSATHQSKIAGVYMNQEAIYDYMDYINVLTGTLSGNKQIKIMNELSSKLKTGAIHGRKFMWCPYYGYGPTAATLIKKIGYVADKIRIFDYVYLQAHVMFNPDASVGNLNGVQCSIAANKVCYRDNVKVIAYKESSTKIGYVMEYTGTRLAHSVSIWNDYKSTFYGYKSKPCLFYWEGNNTATFSEINSWFEK